MASKREADRTAAALRARDVIIFWGPVLVWAAVIFYFSSLNTWTAVKGPPAFMALRKSGHIVEYGVLALLLGRALAATWTLRGEALTRSLLARVWAWGVTLATLYGLSDEIHQHFVPRREFHLTDVLIDALSATAALGIWYIVRTRGSNKPGVQTWSRREQPQS